VVTFSSDFSSEVRVLHLKSLHVLAHYRNIRVLNAVLDALWDFVRFSCLSSFNVEEVLEVLQNACAQFCLAEFHMNHTMTLIPCLFSILSNPESMMEAIYACQVLNILLDYDACSASFERSFKRALEDCVKLFVSMCTQPTASSSHTSSAFQEFFTWVFQLMLNLLLRQGTLLSTDLLSSCLQSLASPQFLYDDVLKVEIFSLLAQVCLHHDLIESAMVDSSMSRHVIDVVVNVLSFLENLSPPAVSDSLNFIFKGMQVLQDSQKKQVYLRCMRSSVLNHLWSVCFHLKLNKNLMNFFADVVIVASDPRVSSLTSELHSGVSKLITSKIESFSHVDASDESSCLLQILKFALVRRPSDCCFGALGLISPPILVSVQNEEPVMFQMATSFRGIQSAFCLGPCSMIACDHALDNAAALAHSIGAIIELTHEETIPNRLSIVVQTCNVEFVEPAPLLLLPQMLGPRLLPWLHSLAFSDVKLLQNSALDLCCLLPSFDRSLAKYLNESTLDKFSKMAAAECDVDASQVFFSCLYACSLMAARSCNISDQCEIFELSDSHALFCCDFIAYCASQLEAKPSAVWNRIYLVGILSSLQCLNQCSKSQLPPHCCSTLLSVQKLIAGSSFSSEANSLNSLANCPVGHMSLCRGVIHSSVSLAAEVACAQSRLFFSQFLNITLHGMPGALLRAAYDSVSRLIRTDSDRDVLDTIISACLAVPLVCRTFEFNRAFMLYSKVVPFLSRRPDILTSSTRVELLVSACRAIDSIDWSYCHSVRNGQTLICHFLYMFELMLKVADASAQDSVHVLRTAGEVVARSF
jgi:hypothetical protein